MAVGLFSTPKAGEREMGEKRERKWRVGRLVVVVMMPRLSLT